MSWDVLVYKLEGPRPADAAIAGLLAPTLEVPREAAPRLAEMGAPADVRDAVDRVFPRTDWESECGGMWVLADTSISFFYGKDAARPHLAIRVYGAGDVRAAVARLCLENGWTAVELETGTYFNAAPYERQVAKTTRLTGMTDFLPRSATAVLPALPKSGPRREVVALLVAIAVFPLTAYGLGYSNSPNPVPILDSAGGVALVAAIVTWVMYNPRRT